MSDEDWAACPTTTNAIESYNMISHSKTCQLSGSMQHYWRQTQVTWIRLIYKQDIYSNRMMLDFAREPRWLSYNHAIETNC